MRPRAHGSLLCQLQFILIAKLPGTHPCVLAKDVAKALAAGEPGLSRHGCYGFISRAQQVLCDIDAHDAEMMNQRFTIFLMKYPAEKEL